MQVWSLTCFILSILHTFSASWILSISTRYSKRTWINQTLRFLGEVELIFGVWALVFLAGLVAEKGFLSGLTYIHSLHFQDPIVVALMMAAASSPKVLKVANALILFLSRGLFFVAPGLSFYVTCLIVGPLLGSFITEPAAMTITALLLLDHVYRRHGASVHLKYATLGLLFVNVSVGGVLTPFAAPPVVLVASKWGWTAGYMMTHFGMWAICSIVCSTVGVAFWFRKEIASFTYDSQALFTPSLLIRLKESLFVLFFLMGVIILGHVQDWWLVPVLQQVNALGLFLGGTVLTAGVDNALITYLGSQVPTLGEIEKYALVAGAVSGGGLTVIANAPNLIGFGLLNDYFGPRGIQALGLLAAALFPTLVALFWFGLPFWGAMLFG